MEFKRLSAYDLKSCINTRIPVIFLVKSREIKQYQKGNGDFMVVIMKDKDVEVDAKIWTVTEQVKEKVKPGIVYEGLIDIKPYDKGKDGLSCTIYNLEVSDILPEALADWEPHIQQCNEILNNALSILQGTIYGSICNELIIKQWDKFALWSAGKGMHHTQLGALLCHTATVTKCALRIGQFYNEVYGDKFVNINLLIAAALLHDIGKLKEIVVDKASGCTEYTVDSALQTHLITGILEVDRAAVKLGIDPNSEEVELLQHLIASHHGFAEWGSLMTPNTTEAVILHNSDSMDAELWKFDKHLSKLPGGCIDTVWIGGKARAMYKEVFKGEKEENMQM